MSSDRPTKRARARLACEPCRRKKAKCLGEKPVCSFCARLNQICFYASDSISRDIDIPAQSQSSSPAPVDPTTNGVRTTEERLRLLEAKLAEVIVQPGQHPYQTPGVLQNAASPLFWSVNNNDLSSAVSPLDRPLVPLPSWDIISIAADRYLFYCDCQPLPLFDKANFTQNLRVREPELVFAVLGLALRFCDELGGNQRAVMVAADYSESARRLVMGRITHGPIELSTLQTLCLLSLIDFTNGQYQRANIHSSLAISLAHCAGLISEDAETPQNIEREERRRCFWSIFLLKRLHGVDMSVLDFFAEENFPWYPKTTGRNVSVDEENQSSTKKKASSAGETKDLGMMAYGIQLSEVWFKTTKYARRRGTSSSLPPWSPKSEYATVMAQAMDYETRMPYIHRYKQSGFASRTLEELNHNRDYWAPWLFVQFLYHTNFCLLNHPLILALRLRTFKCSMPEVFLQHTADLITTHGGWIVHLIDTLRRKGFKITDPFLAHCVAIVATIFLQESYTGDVVEREKKKTMFETCYVFVLGFAQDWPHIARLATELRKLQETMSESRDTGNNPRVVSQSLLIDLGRVWHILEYCSTNDSIDSAPGLFGQSLHVQRKEPMSEVISTSILPPPTRLESATSAPVATTGSIQGAQPFQEVLETPGSSSYNPGWTGGVQLFSDDELAVLFDSFFDPRDEINANMEGLWGPGNL